MTNLSVLSKEIRQFDSLYLLNDLHKASGNEAKHKPSNFLRIEQTQELIAEINSFSDMRSCIKTMNGVGTYACREIVLAYAMWISPIIHLHVLRAYDQQQSQPSLPIHKSQRYLIAIESGQITSTTPVFDDACVINPHRITELRTLIEEFVPEPLLPEILKSTCQAIKTKLKEDPVVVPRDYLRELNTRMGFGLAAYKNFEQTKKDMRETKEELLEIIDKAFVE